MSAGSDLGKSSPRGSCLLNLTMENLVQVIYIAPIHNKSSLGTLQKSNFSSVIHTFQLFLLIRKFISIFKSV